MLDLPIATLERQHGLVTTEQLREAGADDDMIAWFVRSQRLVQVSRRVLRLAGAPVTNPQGLLAAVLDAGPGAALSHTTALAWWNVPGFHTKDVHVTRPKGAKGGAKGLATCVHTAPLPSQHVRVLEDLPLVSPARALLDLAGMARVHPARVERAVDNAWTLRLVSGRTLHAMLRQSRRRPGVSVMRQVLAERGPDYVPPASGLEARVLEIVRNPLLPELRRQVDAGDDDSWIGRVDFADDRYPFLLEVQSERFHSSLLDSRADATRIARLRAAGFVVATVTDLDVWYRPERVMEVVREGRREAQRRAKEAAA